VTREQPNQQPLRTLVCANCMSWRSVDGVSGECWSPDRLDGDMSAHAGITSAQCTCEAWCPANAEAAIAEADFVASLNLAGAA
jgi:hypothetical protein